MKITPKQQSRLEEFRKKFGHSYESGVYIQTTMEAIEPIEKFIAESMQIAVDEERERWIRKLNMISFGILAFKESEKKRGEEEKRRLVRRDGGPLFAAFSFINKLFEEINSLTTEE